MEAKTVVLQNESCTAAFHTEGGALVQWQLHLGGINPFQFCWEEGAKGKSNVFFRGHFLCLGRWGDPSAGEAAQGHIKHGDFNRQLWNAALMERKLQMSAQSGLEGLQIHREVELDNTAAIIQVKETVQNTLPVGRLYNMVQHPTLAAPFLDETTLVDCNAATGFDYAFETYNENAFSTWPKVQTKEGGLINLVNPNSAYNSVFSFVVNPADEWGWMTAYSPSHNLLLGYVWKRRNYPWIAHWLHFEEGTLKYRGLEFGTTGIHQPIQALWEQGQLNLLHQPTCCFIETGQKDVRSYTSFLLAVPNGFQGVEQVQLTAKDITITEKKSKRKTELLHQLSIDHEL